jgi:hypothetical protein
MKKVIVTTTINPPTEAIRRFDNIPDWDLVVVGDLKTPPDYKLKRGLYCGPEQQEKYDKQLSEAIGWNCIQRRNFGILLAHEMNADVVALVDDDNIPTEDWGKDVAVGREIELNYYETELPAFDPLGATNYPWLWHRGFPLQLVPLREYGRKHRRQVKVDVQADLWDGAPDIDAICRMEHAPECRFDPSNFPLASNRITPFNSQNTFLSKDILSNYFLFPHIGRMDDIWAAYYVQAKGCQVIFAKPSVYQARNPHDAVRDMRQEYLGYEHNLSLVCDLANDAESIAQYLPGQAIWAWILYRRHFSSAAKS